MRTSASARITASIRWRSAARGWQLRRATAASSPAARPSPCRWRGCWSRAPSARFARQAAPDGARDRARARAEQGRDPRALSQPRALWRQSRRRARRLARLFRQGAAPADRSARRRCWSRCRNRRKRAGPTARRDARARARDRVLDRVAAAGIVPADEVARAKAEPVPVGAQADADAGAACRRCRRSRRRPTRSVHRLTIDAHAADAASRSWRASAPARSGPRFRSRSSRSIMRPARCWRASPRPTISTTRRAGQVDMTQALRSPGSTLKPFIYGLGFEDGLVHPETLIEDRPIRYGSYAPENFDLTFQGTVTVRKAPCSCRSTCRRSRCSTRSAPAASPRGWRRPAARWCCPRARCRASPWGSAASASR